MNRRIGTHLKAILVFVVLVGSLLVFYGAVPSLFAQGFELFPGPIIEEPIVPFSARTEVGLSADLQSPRAQALSTFVVTYNGFTPQAQAAFQAAVDIWASQIQSSVPIRITANWTELGPNVLGSAGPINVVRNTTINVVYPIALANKLTGTDLAPTADDIVANFSSTADWYLGTDGNAGSKYDLVTVVLHELAHGLGFIGSMDGSGGTGKWGLLGSPFVFDLFAVNGSLQYLTDLSLFPNPSPQLGAQLVSNNIFFNGQNTRAANSGSPAKLYTPNPWAPGSSYAHLDEATYPPGNPNSLMTYRLGPGEVIHDPGTITRGIFTDIGWGIGRKSIRGDFDGDGITDLTLYRPSNGYWFILRSGVNYSAYNAYQWGLASDIPTLGDFDGDGLSDIAVYRPSTGFWYILQSNGNFTTSLIKEWGLSTDIPVPGDFDGDGKTDIAVYRPASGDWYILQSNKNFTTSLIQRWGLNTDIPVTGDFDGDGKTDIAVYRPASGDWFILQSSSNFTTYVIYRWGMSGDIPVPGDFDGDGKTDIAVYRPSTGDWFILPSSSPATNVIYRWGTNGDIPVPGDFDGDGKTDIAVYRPSTGDWFILRSSFNFMSYVIYRWGSTSDLPVVGLSRP